MRFQLLGQVVNSTDNYLKNCSYKKLQPNPQFFTVQAELGTNTATNLNCQDSMLLNQIQMVKPWKQFFVWEVPLSYKYELYYPNTANNSL